MHGRAQGAALKFFRDVTADQLKTLGDEVIEGDCPGITYYAAGLRGDIDNANRATEAPGVPVRFVADKD